MKLLKFEILYITIVSKKEYYMAGNKMKSTKNGKKSDGKFHSKHIKHDPQAESARAVFGLRDDNNPTQIRSDHITSKISDEDR